MRLRIALAATVISLLTALFATAPAEASATGSAHRAAVAAPADAVPSFCASGSNLLCLFTDSDYNVSGGYSLINASNTDLVNLVGNPGLSLANGTADIVRVYVGINFTGAWACIAPGEDLSNLDNYTFNAGVLRFGYGDPLSSGFGSVTLTSGGSCAHTT
ncbi:MAG TPA: peptidase inhibitor family I36 protein [Actinocrinis sp.]|jgi:hypothetical protein|nr:peptidase inhibitor family I36 protein [Actinocrinis sp.]